MFSNISLSVIVRICLQTAHYGNDWLCGESRTMRIDGIALKMGVCLSVASFAHLAMTAILKGMGVLGGRLFLDSFFFGGTKKNEYTGVQRLCLCTFARLCPFVGTNPLYINVSGSARRANCSSNCFLWNKYVSSS